MASKSSIPSPSRQLIFTTKHEYKIVIEEPSKFQQSIFKDLYEQAARHVKDILTHQSSNSSPYGETSNGFHNTNHGRETDYFNNIIAFSGERGTGKSSCMLSFCKGLQAYQQMKIGSVFNDTELDDFLVKYNFIDIGTIDPSLLEDNSNILDIVVARMFERFQEYINNSNRYGQYQDNEGKRNVLQAFQDLYESLKAVKKDRKNSPFDEVLDTLHLLAEGSNIRRNFQKLVHKFLNFMSGTQQGNQLPTAPVFLLIIDDFDLNVAHAAPMAEELRKYLIIPRTIILMALKPDQLLQIIEQQYRQDFNVMLHNGGIPESEPRAMAGRYQEKLIPENRRIYLPNLHLREAIIPFTFANSHAVEPTDVEQAFIDLIYHKTGMIFIKSPFAVHPLIPDNLRDLHSLYLMLNNMQDAVESPANSTDITDIRRIRTLNLQRFANFFFLDWIKGTLGNGDQNIVEEFRRSDLRLKNQMVISQLRKRLKEALVSEVNDPEANELRQILNPANNPLNLSIGDVLFVFDKAQQYDDSHAMHKLIFALKTSYSLFFSQFLASEDYQSVLELAGGPFCHSSIELIRRNMNAQRRDVFEFNYKTIADSHKSDLEKTLWLHLLISQLGKTQDDYRTRKSRVIEREIEIDANVGQYHYAEFNILAYFLHSIAPEKYIQRFEEKYKKTLEGTDLYSRLKAWRDEYQTAIPIHSIEFMEYILKSSVKSSKAPIEDYVSYLSTFMNRVVDAIKNCADETSSEAVQSTIEKITKTPLHCELKKEESPLKELLTQIDSNRSQLQSWPLSDTDSVTNRERVFNVLAAVRLLHIELINNKTRSSIKSKLKQFLGKLDNTDYNDLINRNEIDKAYSQLMGKISMSPAEIEELKRSIIKILKSTSAKLETLLKKL